MTSSTRVRARAQGAKANGRRAPKRASPKGRSFAFASLVAGILILGGVAILMTRTPNKTAGTALATAPVSISGGPLPTLGQGTDAAVGMRVPQVTGKSFDGTSVSIGAIGRPQVIIFLAHWCPHCQREVPVVQRWLEAGGLRAGVDLVTVVTETSPSRPNYPPAAWLQGEGWTPSVLLDDETSSVAASYGLTGTPFWVFVDTQGRVVARASGELDAGKLSAIIGGLR